MGKRVNFTFLENARLFIRNNTVMNMTAPTNGEMAGILISAAPDNDPDLTFEIQSQNARNFTGLVYLPNNMLKIGDDIDGDGACDPFNDEVRDPFLEINLDLGIGLGLSVSIGAKNKGTTQGKGNKYGHYKKKYGVDSVPKVRIGADDIKGCISNLGQNSDWTAIIARQTVVTSGVNLVLNARYSSSTTPVPENNGAIGSSARLLQ